MKNFLCLKINCLENLGKNFYQAGKKLAAFFTLWAFLFSNTGAPPSCTRRAGQACHQALRQRALAERRGSAPLSTEAKRELKDRIQGYLFDIATDPQKDWLDRAAAVRKLGRTPEFRNHPEDCADMIYDAAYGLYLIAAFGEEEGVQIAAAGALGELGRLPIQGEKRDAIELMLIRLAGSQISYRVKTPAVRALRDIRNSACPLSSPQHMKREAIANLTKAIGTRGPPEWSILCMAVLVDYCVLGIDDENTLKFREDVTNTLKTLAGLSTTALATKMNFAVEVKLEAIFQMARVFKEVCGAFDRQAARYRNTGAGILTVRSPYPAACGRMGSMYVDTCDDFIEIIKDEKNPDVQSAAGEALLKVSEVFFSLHEIKYMRAKGEFAIARIGNLLYGSHRQKINSNPHLARVLLRTLEFGHPRMVKSAGLMPFILSGDSDVVKQAARTILKINDPGAVAQLRDFYQRVVKAGVRRQAEGWEVDAMLTLREVFLELSLPIPQITPAPAASAALASVLRPQAFSDAESRAAREGASDGEGRARAAVERTGAGTIQGDWIVRPDGARIHRTARVDDDCVVKGPRTIIHAGAVITKCSVIVDAVITEGARVEASVYKTAPDTDKWEYKEKSDLVVRSREPAHAGRGAKIVKSVVINSSVGDWTAMRESTAEHSEIGGRNRFKKAKLSLAKTKDEVSATWAELSEGIFGFGFNYDGLALMRDGEIGLFRKQPAPLNPRYKFNLMNARSKQFTAFFIAASLAWQSGSVSPRGTSPQALRSRLYPSFLRPRAVDERPGLVAPGQWQHIVNEAEALSSDQLWQICHDTTPRETGRMEENFRLQQKRGDFVLVPINARVFDSFSDIANEIRQLRDEFGITDTYILGAFRESELSRKKCQGEYDDDNHKFLYTRDRNNRVVTIVKYSGPTSKQDVASAFSIPDHLEPNPRLGGWRQLEPLLDASAALNCYPYFDLALHSTAIDCPLLQDETRQEGPYYWYVYKNISDYYQRQLLNLDAARALPDQKKTDEWNWEHIKFVDLCDEIISKNPGYFLHYSTKLGRWILIAHGANSDMRKKREWWVDIALLDLSNPYARRYATAVPSNLAHRKIRRFRADCAMAMVKDGRGGFFDTWSDHPTLARDWPSEMWGDIISEVKGRYPDARFLAEAYWLFDTLTACGFNNISQTIVFNFLNARDISGLRRYLIKEPIAEQKTRFYTIISHDDEPSYITDYSRTPRDVAANLARDFLVIATIPGTPIIHSEQLRGFFARTTAKWHNLESVDRPRPQLAALLKEITAIARDDLFRDGELFVFANDEPQILAYARHHNGRAAVFVSNFSDYFVRDTIPVRAAAQQLGISARHDCFYAFIDRLRGDIYLRHGPELIQHGLFVRLPPNESHLFMIQPLVSEEGNYTPLVDIQRRYNGRELSLADAFLLMRDFGLRLDFPCGGVAGKAAALKILTDALPAKEIPGVLRGPSVCRGEITFDAAGNARAQIDALRNHHPDNEKVQRLCAVLDTAGRFFGQYMQDHTVHFGVTGLETNSRIDKNNIYLELGSNPIWQPASYEGRMNIYDAMGYVGDAYMYQRTAEFNPAYILTSLFNLFDPNTHQEIVTSAMFSNFHAHRLILYLYLRGEKELAIDTFKKLAASQYYTGQRAAASVLLSFRDSEVDTAMAEVATGLTTAHMESRRLIAANIAKAGAPQAQAKMRSFVQQTLLTNYNGLKEGVAFDSRPPDEQKDVFVALEAAAAFNEPLMIDLVVRQAAVCPAAAKAALRDIASSEKGHKHLCQRMSRERDFYSQAAIIDTLAECSAQPWQRNDFIEALHATTAAAQSYFSLFHIQQASRAIGYMPAYITACAKILQKPDMPLVASDVLAGASPGKHIKTLAEGLALPGVHRALFISAVRDIAEGMPGIWRHAAVRDAAVINPAFLTFLDEIEWYAPQIVDYNEQEALRITTGYAWLSRYGALKKEFPQSAEETRDCEERIIQLVNDGRNRDFLYEALNAFADNYEATPERTLSKRKRIDFALRFLPLDGTRSRSTDEILHGLGAVSCVYGLGAGQDNEIVAQARPATTILCVLNNAYPPLYLTYTDDRGKIRLTHLIFSHLKKLWALGFDLDNHTERELSKLVDANNRYAMDPFPRAELEHFLGQVNSRRTAAKTEAALSCLLRPRAHAENEVSKTQTKSEIIYEINTRSLGKKFSQITDDDIRFWRETTGATMLWFMGAWEISPYSEKLNKFWEKENNEKLPRAGSAYSIKEYKIAAALGGEEEFRNLVSRANAIGVRIMLDVVPNHMAADTPLLAEHPEYFLSVAARKLPQGHEERLQAESLIRENSPAVRLESRRSTPAVFRHGAVSEAINSPLSPPAHKNVFYYGSSRGNLDPPWTDTVQLNYTTPYFREYMRGVIFKAAELCNGGGLRFDLVALAFRDHIRKNWFGHLSDQEFDTLYPKDNEFWKPAISELKKKYPDIVLLGELYGGSMEGDLAQQTGFDYYYEDYFRKCLLEGNINGLKNFLQSRVLSAGRTDFIKFLENHDIAERIAAKLDKEAALAAATLLYTLPGGALIYHDQQMGRSRSSPSATVVNGYVEEDDARVAGFYRALAERTSGDMFTRGSFKLLQTNRPDNVLAFEREYGGRKALVVVNYSSDSLRDVEINVDGKSKRYDFAPGESRIETQWWDEKQRGGILCPLFSIRREGSQGIGDMPGLEKFIGFMSNQGADYLVILSTTAINPDDHCPYVGISRFANNAIGYLGIDEFAGPDRLKQYKEAFIREVADALVTAKDLPYYFSGNFERQLGIYLNNIKGAYMHGQDEKALRQRLEDYLRGRIEAANSIELANYPLVMAYKEYCLRRAFEEAHEGLSQGKNADFNRYKERNKTWVKNYGLEEYALFHELFNHNKEKPWWEWDENYINPHTLVVRSMEALDSFKEKRKTDILFYEYLQWLYYERWQKLKRHARENGKYLIGDMPLYPAPNSADEWARQDIFDRTKTNGAPPEPIAPAGQDWGSHPYRWDERFDDVMEYLEATIRYMAQFYDGIRIDHILGIIQEWNWQHTPGQPPQGQFYPSDSKEAAKRGEMILRRLAAVAAETNTLLIGDDIGDRDADTRRMLDRLSLNLPNLYLYNPVGWRERHMAKRPHVMAVEATHDMPATFRERMPELRSKPQDSRQLADFLDAHAAGGIERPDDEIESVVTAAMRNEQFYCFTLQTVLGIRGAQINVPGVGTDKRPENWAWLAPPAEALQKMPNLGYFGSASGTVPKSNLYLSPVRQNAAMSSVLRPLALGEGQQDDAPPRSGGVSPAGMFARVGAPDEETLIGSLERGWQYRFKEGDKLNVEAVRNILGVNRAPLTLTSAIQKFHGDVYLVPDADLRGRKFWFSSDTTAIYFGEEAFKQTGAERATHILIDAQSCLDRNELNNINSLEFAPEIKQDKVVEARKKTAPASAGAAKPAAAAAVAAAAKPPPSTGVSPEGTSPDAHKEMFDTARACWSRRPPRNTAGSSLLEDTVGVWIDTSDSPKPGFNFVELQFPAGAFSDCNISGIPRRLAPVLPDPKTMGPPPGIGRYMAVVNFKKLDESFASKDNGKYKKMVKLNDALSGDADDTVLRYNSERKSEWIERKRRWMDEILTESDADFEKAVRTHPEQTAKVLNFARVRCEQHRRLGEAARAAGELLMKRADAGEIGKEAFCEVVDVIYGALAPWPRLQEAAVDLKAGFAEGEKKKLAACVGTLTNVIPDEARLRDVLEIRDLGLENVTAEAYYGAFRKAWLEELKETETASGDDAVREIYRLGRRVLALEWEAAFTEAVSDAAKRVEPDKPLSQFHAGCAGVLFLTAEDKIRRFVPGGGAVSHTDGLGGYFMPSRLSAWRKTGDKIVLLFPSITNDPNFPQLAGYVESRRMLEDAFGESSEVWLGTISVIDGRISLFKPSSSGAGAWKRLSEIITDRQEQWEAFEEYLRSKVYRPPRIDDEAVEKAIEKAKKSKRMSIRTTTSKKAVPTRKESSADASVEAVVLDSINEGSRICHLAETLPAVIRAGLKKCFGEETAAELMGLIADRNNFGPDFNKIGRNVKNKPIDNLYLAIASLAQDIQVYVGERLTTDIMDNEDVFTRVEIEGLENAVVPEKALEEEAAEEAPAEQEPPAAKAARISEALIKTSRKHPRDFPQQTPQQKKQAEGYIRLWVEYRLGKGGKVIYPVLRQDWAKAKSTWSSVEPALAVVGENLNRAATETDAARRNDLIEKTEHAMTDLSQTAESMPEIAHAVYSAGARVAEVKEANGALNAIAELTAGIAAGGEELTAGIAAGGEELAAELSKRADEAIAKMGSSVRGPWIAAISAAKQKLAARMEGLKKFGSMSPDQQAAHELLADGRYQEFISGQENRLITKFLCAVVDRKPFDKTQRVIARASAMIKRPGAFAGFYRTVLGLAQRQCPPGMDPKQSIGAARYTGDDWDKEAELFAGLAAKDAVIVVVVPEQRSGRAAVASERSISNHLTNILVEIRHNSNLTSAGIVKIMKRYFPDRDKAVAAANDYLQKLQDAGVISVTQGQEDRLAFAIADNAFFKALKDVRDYDPAITIVTKNEKVKRVMANLKSGAADLPEWIRDALAEFKTLAVRRGLKLEDRQFLISWGGTGGAMEEIKTRQLKPEIACFLDFFGLNPHALTKPKITACCATAVPLLQFRHEAFAHASPGEVVSDAMEKSQVMIKSRGDPRVDRPAQNSVILRRLDYEILDIIQSYGKPGILNIQIAAELQKKHPGQKWHPNERGDLTHGANAEIRNSISRLRRVRLLGQARLPAEEEGRPAADAQDASASAPAPKATAWDNRAVREKSAWLGYETEPLTDEVMAALAAPGMTPGKRIHAVIEARRAQDEGNELNPYSLYSISRVLGLHRNSIQDMKRRDAVPYPENLYRFSKLLRVDPVLLWKGVPEREFSPDPEYAAESRYFARLREAAENQARPARGPKQAKPGQSEAFIQMLAQNWRKSSDHLEVLGFLEDLVKDDPEKAAANMTFEELRRLLTEQTRKAYGEKKLARVLQDLFTHFQFKNKYGRYVPIRVRFLLTPPRVSGNAPSRQDQMEIDPVHMEMSRILHEYSRYVKPRKGKEMRKLITGFVPAKSPEERRAAVEKCAALLNKPDTEPGMDGPDPDEDENNPFVIANEIIDKITAIKKEAACPAQEPERGSKLAASSV